MARVALAFSAFFRLLFGKQLPAEAASYLPADARPAALPAARPEPAPAPPHAARPAPPAAAPARPAEPERPKVATAQHHRDGALALLALLQREGRFVDFVRESADGVPDAQLGSVAREIHRGCRKVIDQYLTIEPVMPGEEGTRAAVPKGFDPAEIRLIGEARGEPPYRGTLRHHGWRVVDARLPALAEGVDRLVVAPAEVELPAV
jgi:hypothetical protein